MIMEPTLLVDLSNGVYMYADETDAYTRDYLFANRFAGSTFITAIPLGKSISFIDQRSKIEDIINELEEKGTGSFVNSYVIY